MNSKELDQLKSYSTVIVKELHHLVFDDYLFARLRGILKLAEEMECEIMNMERKRAKPKTNIIQFQDVKDKTAVKQPENCSTI